MYILDVNSEIPAEVDEQLHMVSDFACDFIHCICLGKRIIFRFIRIKLNGIEENERMEVTWKYLKWNLKSKFSPGMQKVEFKLSLSPKFHTGLQQIFFCIFSWPPPAVVLKADFIDILHVWFELFCLKFQFCKFAKTKIL